MTLVVFSILKRICSRHKGLYILLSSLGAAVGCLEFLFLALLIPFFNKLLNIQGGIKVMPFLVDNTLRFLSIIFSGIDEVTVLILVLLLLTSVKMVLTMAYIYLSGAGSAAVLHELKSGLLDKYAVLPIEFFLNRKQGDLVNTTLFSTAKAGIVVLQVPNIFLELLRTSAVAIYVIAINPRLIFVLGAIILVIYFVGDFLSRKVSFTLGKERVKTSVSQLTIFNEFLTGIKQIKIFGQSQRWLARFKAASQRYSDICRKDYIWMSAPRLIIEFLAFSILLGAALYVYARQSNQFSAQLPLLGAIGLALMKLLPSLSNLGRIQMELVGSVPDAQNVLHVLDMDFRKEWQGTERFSGFKNEIAFDSVLFSHENRESILNGITCQFPKNKTTAIVGRSGSGKTTILNLLLGLYPVGGGTIRVDGRDLKEFEIQSWRSQIGFVSQEPFVFHASIFENITLGDPSFSLENVHEAARLANADEFINALPEKFETVVGERGMKLSGGQQQRLSIARALLRKPQVIIFDEATSSLDQASEKLIQQTIASIAKNYTIIMVAHRLATVIGADQILFLEKGEIVERGTYADLIKLDNAFLRLFERKAESTTTNDSPIVTEIS